MLSFQTIQPDRIPEDIQAHPFSLSRDELNKASRIDLGRAYLVCYRPGYRSKMTTLGLLVPAAIQDRVFSMERRHNWNHRGAKAIRRCDCEATIEFLRIALANGVPSPTFVCRLQRARSPFLGGSVLIWSMPRCPRKTRTISISNGEVLRTRPKKESLAQGNSSIGCSDSLLGARNHMDNAGRA